MALLCQKQYTFENCIVLHKETTNTQKQTEIYRRTHTNTHKNTQTHTKTHRPGTAEAISFSLGFLLKSQKTSTVLNKAKICNGKYKGLANPCVNEEQNAFVLVLHKEATNTQKQTETYRLSQQKTLTEGCLEFKAANQANQCIGFLHQFRKSHTVKCNTRR